MRGFWRYKKIDKIQVENSKFNIREVEKKLIIQLCRKFTFQNETGAQLSISRIMSRKTSKSEKQTIVFCVTGA